MAEMTPADWRDVLDERLTERWARWRVPDEYFEGIHPLAFATAKFREAFGNLLRASADNWCRNVVYASVERLKVQGFRFGSEKRADEDAWAIWQANGMDAQIELALTEAVKLGESYILVAPPEREGGTPRMTVEHPSEMIVAYAPGDRRVKLAAFKRWIDENDGYVYATLYLPQALHKWRSAKPAKEGAGKIVWKPREGDSGGKNPLGVVPVASLCNAPSMLGGGQSDLTPLIPLQNSINKLCADMLIASEFSAYRQRVMTGVEQAIDPATGQPLKIELGITRLFTVEAADAKVFDLAPSELKNYIEGIEMYTQHFAAQARVPPHYLLGKMLNVSGDALDTSEVGLDSKVDGKKISFGEGCEDAMRLAFLAKGDDVRANAEDAETIWAPSRRRSFAQIVDGAGKLHDMGMPIEVVMEELGWSPQKIARAKAMQSLDDLMRASAEPSVPPAGQQQTEAA